MNATSWFEIPAQDLGRAQRFYETLLGTPLRRESMGPVELAIFPYAAPEGSGGCLMAGGGTPAPSTEGTRVYLSVGPTLDAVLARLPAAGGALALPKTALPPGMGFFAHVLDSEGNRVGLHSLA
jgi:uncharacterized protein